MTLPNLEEWKDVSDELYRKYIFGGGDVVLIHEPYRLHVSDSGGHRILDSAGASHYIPPRWIHLHWRVRDGRPPFAF